MGHGWWSIIGAGYQGLRQVQLTRARGGLRCALATLAVGVVCIERNQVVTNLR